MDREQLRTVFGFLGGLALSLLICVVSLLVLPKSLETVAVIVAAVFALASLAYVHSVSPDYNVGGKVVVGVIAGLLTTLVMVWFMPTWAWAGVFVIAEVVVYAGAIAKSQS